MTEAPRQYYRNLTFAYPWFGGAAILLAGSYMLAIHNDTPWAIVAFAVGLAVIGIGFKLVRQPAARIAAGLLTLSDPRGYSFKLRSFRLDHLKRVTVITTPRGMVHRLRGDVLLANLAGVPADQIEAFLKELQTRGVEAGR